MYSGSNSVNNVAWSGNNTKQDQFLHPVAQLKANMFNLYDMSGNIREWCNDPHGDLTARPEFDPQGADQRNDLANHRVFRSGGYKAHPLTVLVNFRSRDPSGNNHSELGVRLIWEPQDA